MAKLDGLLSPSAEELYRRLLRVGVVHVDGAGELPADSAVRELVDKHFASWATDGTGLVAVPPWLAIESALLALERGVVRAHEACVRALAVMPTLQEAYERSPGCQSDDQRVRIIDEQQAAHLSVDLLETARQEVLAFQIILTPDHPLWTTAVVGPEVAVLGPDVTVVERLCSRGVRVRCIFAKEFLDSPQARDAVERYARQGLEIRAIHALPTTMIMVDARVALVPLDAGRTTGAVMFRQGAATDLLQAAFELHWSRSVPLVADADCHGDAPSETQMLVLRLLAAGMKDESIARHLQVSLRTVRRNITTLGDKMGAPTRFALAAVAAQRGWIAAPAA